MHRAPLGILIAVLIAGTVGVAGCSPFARPELAEESAAAIGSSEDARQVVDYMLKTANSKRLNFPRKVEGEDVVCASKALRRAKGVKVLSIAESSSARSESSVTVFDVKVDLAYPERSALQSGTHVLRLWVVKTPDGWRVQDDPWM